MSNEFFINVNTIEKAKRFTNLVDKFESDVDIKQGKYVINAKSIMGLFSLNLLESLMVKIISEDEEEIRSFNDVMEEFKWEK